MPVVLIFENAGLRTKISTGMTSENKFTGREFPEQEPNARAKTMALARLLMKIDEHLLMAEDEAWEETIAFVRALPGGRRNSSGMLWKRMEEFAATRKADNTRRSYTQTAVKVKEYDGKATLEDVKKKWMDGFADWLEKHGMGVNSRAMHLKNVKATMTWAYDEGIVKELPLFRYKIKKEKVPINNISLEELRRFRDCSVSPRLKIYRDLWMLSFYLCGINAVDLLNLTWDNIKGHRIVYRRHKTGKMYDIPIVDEAMAIIEEYRGKGYLLRVLDENSYWSWSCLWNARLKMICETSRVPGVGGRIKLKREKPLLPRLTVYSARYTFASLGAEIGIPRETIALCLGHSWADVTSHYIAYDQKRVDDAVRKIVDYVNADLKK